MSGKCASLRSRLTPQSRPNKVEKTQNRPSPRHKPPEGTLSEHGSKNDSCPLARSNKLLARLLKTSRNERLGKHFVSLRNHLRDITTIIAEGSGPAKRLFERRVLHDRLQAVLRGRCIVDNAEATLLTHVFEAIQGHLERNQSVREVAWDAAKLDLKTYRQAQRDARPMTDEQKARIRVLQRQITDHRDKALMIADVEDGIARVIEEIEAAAGRDRKRSEFYGVCGEGKKVIKQSWIVSNEQACAICQ